jgi:hypothetical protein
MIQELLGQTNFVGRDGFYWWMGQVETEKGEQQKGDDRYKVRIVGHHLKDCNAVPHDDLPWAIVMMPPTAPRREGNGDYHSVKYKSGDWVVGFFLDGKDGQQPVIIGSIGQQVNATTQVNKDKPDGKCLAFTTFVEQGINPASGVSATQQAQLQAGGVSGNGAAAGTNTAGQVNLNNPVNNTNQNASGQLLGTKCCNSEVNPSGEYFCVAIADAKCDAAQNDQSKFDSVLTDLFYNIQGARGQYGTRVVSKYTGKLYDYVDIAQGYINKITKIGSSVVARVKGEAFALIKQGAKKIITFLLTQEVSDPTQASSGPLADGSKAFKPAKKRVGRLRGITAWINKQLERVNCVMDDLDKKLMDFLTDLIFSALEKVFNAARCYIDKIVNDIFQKIASFLEDALTAILGPLQTLLSIIADPLNILSAAIAQLFDLLGISCGGPKKKCATKEQLKDCTGPCDKKEQSNYLDDLLKSIENGNLDTAAGSGCDSTSAPAVTRTTITIIGGTPNPNNYSGSTTTVVPADSTDNTTDPNVFYGDLTDTITSDTTGTGTTTTNADNLANVTPVGGVTPSTGAPSIPFVSPIYEQFNNVDLDYDVVDGDINSTNSKAGDVQFVSASGIFDISINNVSYSEFSGSSLVEFESAFADVESITYSLTSSKSIVFEGETIVFTLVANGGVVEDNTIFNYTMFGDISASDFQSNTTTGTMKMVGNKATAFITIADDALDEPVEVVTFNVLEVYQSTMFTIAASGGSTDTTISPTTPVFTEPVIGTPEVCDDGRIMEVPIISKGDPYIVPPMAVITGAGFGASAKVELDERGYISRILIQRAGTGYRPTRSRTNCTIAKFVMTQPGLGYYREPSVYVNGKSGIGRALIDADGTVTGIEVIDKTLSFGCTPKVEVFGGNGLGATAIPVMECRDDALYSAFQKEVAPSGTDSVIDCP